MIYMPHWPKLISCPLDGNAMDRVENSMRKLGNPERDMPPIVHISGTNGKGSTLAFIRYIMQAAGYRVHAYTSPHLIYFNERIVIAGKHISDNELYNLLEECRIAINDQPTTLFEAATITAFLAFARNKADITLIEVGMGGRLDATNVIENPILTIITSIALDHTEYLGPTVEIIAGEKAGIMKNSIPCVIAAQENSVMDILGFHAALKKAPLYRNGLEWNCYKENNKMIFQSSVQSIEFPLPSLTGNHQITNAGNAIAACSILSGKYGFNIHEGDIARGLQHTYWPARLEQIKTGKLISLLPNDWKLFLDGAHNNDGARILSEWVTDNFPDGIYMIFGLTRNRDVEQFLHHFKSYIKLLCAVCVQSELNANNAVLIKEIANKIGINAFACESISDSISNHILKITNQNVKTILICGSLFLARDLAIENGTSAQMS
ncbi:bifunctional folylpolyglutamate synthase/dihydrofolate synthase [Wolbachia pipientis]|uniref:tetrahydrofolate synthase n=1 Tax=Wolbachia pipientis TaxID=955 RepID=A0A1E7QKC4_WOLPI|nr:folylpolyglutamate synthase/dihydrofolate synthase family protein [Wolbachia pipientis]OEY86930.1 bifunctional folylpolyglutamate synthase/dihydrofolate synthase [Wolbachia pipientis]